MSYTIYHIFPKILFSHAFRFCKSESTESLGIHSSGLGGTHPALGALRQQAAHSRSNTGLMRRSASVAELLPRQKLSQTQIESRSQKHNRVIIWPLELHFI